MSVSDLMLCVKWSRMYDWIMFVLCFRHALPFEAFFAPNSDPEFTVTPTSGDLTPAGTEGTLIRVGYKPQIYGKTHKAKLVIQVRT